MILSAVRLETFAVSVLMVPGPGTSTVVRPPTVVAVPECVFIGWATEFWSKVLIGGILVPGSTITKPEDEDAWLTAVPPAVDNSCGVDV